MQKILFSGALFLAAPVLAQPTDAPKPALKPKADRPKAEKKTLPTGGKVFVRVLHATIGVPAVDVSADGLKIASGLSFKKLSTYIEIKSGATTFKVLEAGKTNSLAEVKKTLGKDKFYTLAIYGDKTPKLDTVMDSFGKDTPEKAKLKVTHLSPEAPDVLITATKKGATDDKYTKFIAKPIAYEKSGTATKKPGAVNLQVRTADGKIVKNLGEINLAAGSRTAAYAVGKVGATGDSAFDVIVGAVAKP